MLGESMDAAVEHLEAFEVGAQVHQRADVLVRHAVEVALVLHEAVGVDQANDDLARVVRPHGQGLQKRPLLGEHLGKRPISARMRPSHRPLRRPPGEHLLELLET